MPVLNFNTQRTRRQPIRAALSRFLTSAVRGIIERSEGQRPAEVFYPYKHLPVYLVDTELEDGIVIPKGTIVSCMCYNDQIGGASPIAPPASGVNVYVGADALSPGTNWATPIDSGYWGYDDHVAGLLTICNGGDNVAGSHALEAYSAADVTVGTIKSNGSAAAAADASAGRLANYPIGIVMADVYQDIRGKYLNYDVFDKWGILCDWYIEVPYFDSTIDAGRNGFLAGADLAVANNVEGTATTANYAGVYRSHQYLYNYNSGTNAPLRAGCLVKSDQFGKFRTQHSALDGSYGATEEPWNAHTVGRVLVLDNRFPKDMLDTVDTYPGSGMPGTETGGLPAPLFNFVKDYLTATGSTPSIATIVARVRSGAFGMARIQLHIA